MPLDVLGCTRATLMRSMSLCACLKRLDNLHNAHRDGDKRLQLFFLNEEFLVCTSHQLVLITSLPFVHTARRSYRLNDPVRPLDWGNEVGSPNEMPREVVHVPCGTCNYLVG